MQWSGFTEEVRQYIEQHEDGLHLYRIVGEYVTEMVELYAWLLSQYSTLHEPGVPPRHLSEGRAPEVHYRATASRQGDDDD